MSRDASQAFAAHGLATIPNLAAALAIDDKARGWPAELALDLEEAVAHHSGRGPSLTALRLLREGVAELHGLALERELGWLPQAAASHHALDLAVSTAGGVPDLIEDDLDWGAGQAEDTLTPSDWTLPAIEGAIPLARDLWDVAARIASSTCRHDMERVLGLALCLRCVLRTPGPWRAPPLRQGFEEAGLAAQRASATLSGLGLAEQAALAAHLREVFEGSLPPPAPGPGPG